MKKMYFFALAAAGLMTACSSDDAVSNGGGADETALVPIQIGVSPVSVTTRGTGTVGGTDAETNKWANEKVNVYMFEKGTMTLAEFKFDDEGETQSHKIYENKEFTAPASQDSVTTLKDASNAIEYYPMTGSFDFWGYRIDDATTDGDYGAPKAVTAEGAAVADGSTAAAYVTKFTIDGSQDIMRGKAELTADQKSLIGTGNEERAYSAFAARKGVQPVIDFEHLLTRFTFQVVPGSASAAGITDPVITGYKAVKVEGIKIVSKNKATLPVAYTAEYTNNGLTFDEESTGELALKSADKDGSTGKLKNLTAVSLDNKWNSDTKTGTATTIGSALLVAPGETSYEMILSLSQEVPTSTVAGDNNSYGAATKKQNLTLPIKMTAEEEGEAKKFEAGHSYNVVITVYGLEQIKVDANLSMWKEDAGINIDAQ